MAEDRGAAMVARVARAAERAGVEPEDLRRIARCHERALRARLTAFHDQRHAEYLHGGRAALILLEDASFADPDAIALSLLYDSRRPDLRTAVAEVEQLAGSRAAAFAQQLPECNASPAEIVEALVTAELAPTLVALADALDYARHLHLASRSEWPEFHALVENTYLPVARRAHPQLASRFEWWTKMFATRYLR